MYIDPLYLYLVLPTLLLSLWASMRVKTTFNRYSSQYAASRITGAEAAQRVLMANGVSDVRIERVQGNLTDHYDPRGKVIRLSSPVYDSSSTAAIGVACHEAGHALQYAQGYSPIKLRMAIIPITNFGSRLAVPLVILGLVLSSMGEYFIGIAYLGIWCFAFSVLFQLVTLPVEFNASRRALAAIEHQGMLSETELQGSKKVLSAAALTYVAALAVSLAQLLRLLSIVNRRRN